MAGTNGWKKRPTAPLLVWKHAERLGLTQHAPRGCLALSFTSDGTSLQP